MTKKQAEPALLLNGKPLDLSYATPALESLIQFLDKLPPNELVDMASIVSRKIMTENTLYKLARKCAKLEPYRYRIQSKGWLFGSPAAIAALLKQLEAQQ